MRCAMCASSTSATAKLFTTPTDEMPVFGTMAARFNDDGVTALYQALVPALVEKGLKLKPGKLPLVTVKQSSSQRAIVPAQRVRYLAEIADSRAWLSRPYRRAGEDCPRASGAAHCQGHFRGLRQVDRRL